MVELRGFEPLTFCMPCLQAPSGGVSLGRVSARQGNGLAWQTGCICCGLGALSLGSSLVTGPFGIVDTGREVVPLQTQLAAFGEPEYGGALA